MTNAEYKALYKAAQKQFPQLTAEAMRELAKVYASAAKIAADAVRAAEYSGLSSLTVESWRQIELQLTLGAERIVSKLELSIPKTIRIGSGIVTNINEEYFLSAASGALSTTGIQNLFIQVNDSVLASMVSRVYSNGYTYSETIWRVGEYYQSAIKKVILEGAAIGRDAAKIARDLEVYVQQGRGALATRWGDLIKGTAEWNKRIPFDVSYASLRLIRSEMGAALQDSSKLSGLMNPGCTGEYDWVRGGSQDWNCDCPDFAKNSPYEYDKVPGYPHPNCLCWIRPVLRDRKEFVDDLERWSNGESVPYLDNWNDNFYQYAG